MQQIHLQTTTLCLLVEMADAQLHLSLSAASGRGKSMEEHLNPAARFTHRQGPDLGSSVMN
jgi:hypothetical protein